MKSILTSIVILLTLSVSGQKVNNQPQAFNNYVELRDSLKLTNTSNIAQHGLFLKVDTLADGSFYVTADTAGVDSLGQLLDVNINTPLSGNILIYNGGTQAWNDDVLTLDKISDVTNTTPSTGQVLRYNGSLYENALLPYAELSGEPFVSATNGWRNIGAATETFSIGAVNDTTTASVHAQNGVQRGVVYMVANNTELNGEDGDIMYVDENNAPTQIDNFSNIQEGRIVFVVGRTSPVGANTSEVITSSTIVLTGIDPAPLGDNQAITFICVRRTSGTGDLILLELSRN